MEGRVEGLYHCGVGLDMEKAFADSKAALCKIALLVHPQQGWELALMSDASSDCIKAALQKRFSPSSPWKPLAFFSKKLEPAQFRYSVFDRKLLACFAGICHFQYILEGWPFPFIQTISHSFMHKTKWLIYGWPCSEASYPRCQSLQLVSTTCLVWTM